MGHALAFGMLGTQELLIVLVTVGAEGASARCDGLHHQGQRHAAERTHQRARNSRRRERARRSGQRRAVAYVCPMHTDIRERARGTCPKCLMDLVAEPAGTKPNARGEGAGASSSGGM